MISLWIDIASANVYATQWIIGVCLTSGETERETEEEEDNDNDNGEHITERKRRLNFTHIQINYT